MAQLRWPPVVRAADARMAKDDEPVYRFPPEPTMVDRMLEAMRWVQWLDVEQRHLVWMRAQRYCWRDIKHRWR